MTSGPLYFVLQVRNSKGLRPRRINSAHGWRIVSALIGGLLAFVGLERFIILALPFGGMRWVALFPVHKPLSPL